MTFGLVSQSPETVTSVPVYSPLPPVTVTWPNTQVNATVGIQSEDNRTQEMYILK